MPNGLAAAAEYAALQMPKTGENGPLPRDQILALYKLGLKFDDIAKALSLDVVDVKSVVLSNAAEAGVNDGEVGFTNDELIATKSRLMQIATTTPDDRLAAKVCMFVVGRSHVPADLKYRAKHKIERPPDVTQIFMQVQAARARAQEHLDV